LVRGLLKWRRLKGNRNDQRQNDIRRIVGNRGFFPGHMAQSGRSEMIAALEKAGHRAIESLAEAHLRADLFRKHAAIANTLRWAALPVTVLIQATPDTPGTMTITHRRGIGGSP
jgi:hypothetical protein